MSTHKTAKFRNTEQGFGLLHLNRLQQSTSNTGFVGEYVETATTKYAGVIYNPSDGIMYGFKGLTSNPFTPGTNGVAQDVVNITGAGFVGAPFQIGSANATTTIVAGTNITATTGNISAPLGSSSAGNVSLSTNQIITTNTNGSLSILPNGTGSLNLGAAGNSVLLPADPSVALGAATKQYVDNLSQGLTAKQECRVRTVSDLANLTSGIITAGSAVTRTITRGINSAIGTDAAAFDGVTLVLNDRILVIMQGIGTGTASDNGIYTVTNVGSVTAPWVLTRATDFNRNNDVTNGAYTFVNVGTVWASTGWVLSTSNAVTIDTTSLTFVQFSQLGTVTGTQLDTGGSTYNIFSNKTGTSLNFRGILLTNNVAGNTTNPLEAVQTINDITVNLDTQKITTVGALASGNITFGFGNISTSNAITTTSTVTGATVQTTGGNIAATGGTLGFAAGTGNNVISVATNIADALSVKSGSTNFLQFQTTTGLQQINVGLKLQLNQGQIVFNAVSGNNLLTPPDNTTNALEIKDAGGQSYVQFISTTGSKNVQFNAPVNLSSALTVNANTFLNGGIQQKVSAISTATTLDNTYTIINVTTGASNIAITLPAAASNTGRSYYIRKADSAAGFVVITPNASDYVDGVQNDVLNLISLDDHAYLICHGSVGWYVY